MRLSQLAPLPIRRAVWKGVEKALVPKAVPVVRPADGPIIVAGMFSTANGLGESARLCLAALRAQGHDALAFDTSRILGQVDMQTAEPVSTRLPDTRTGMLIAHANAPELGRVLLYAGRRQRREWRCASVWAWETPMRPKGWIERASFANELWFPSAFVRAAISPPDDMDARTLFHPVQAVDYKPSNEVFVEPGPVVFTCYADAHSSFERKNPVGAINAFRRAFNHRMDVRLVVKTRNAASRPRAARALAEALGDAPNIIHIDRALNSRDLDALRQRTNVLVSLHRSEGFGLVIAEAMQAGTPVICTDWSAPSEFLTSDCAGLVPARTIPVDDPHGVYADKGHIWADPDIETAAMEMRRLVECSGLAQERASLAKQRAEMLFSSRSYCNSAGFE